MQGVIRLGVVKSHPMVIFNQAFKRHEGEHRFENKSDQGTGRTPASYLQHKG